MGFVAPSRRVKVDFSDLGKRIREEIKKFFEEW